MAAKEDESLQLCYATWVNDFTNMMELKRDRKRIIVAAAFVAANNIF